MHDNVVFLNEKKKFFRDVASEIQSLQKVTNENRNIFVNAIDDLDAEGGTCLGEGLKQGLIVNILSNFT